MELQNRIEEQMTTYEKMSLLKNQVLKDASGETSYIAGICKMLSVLYMKGNKVLCNEEFGSLGIFYNLPWECDMLRTYAYTDNGVICLPIRPACPVYGCLVVRVYFNGKVGWSSSRMTTSLCQNQTSMRYLNRC